MSKNTPHIRVCQDAVVTIGGYEVDMTIADNGDLLIDLSRTGYDEVNEVRVTPRLEVSEQWSDEALAAVEAAQRELLPSEEECVRGFLSPRTTTPLDRIVEMISRDSDAATHILRSLQGWWYSDGVWRWRDQPPSTPPAVPHRVALGILLPLIHKAVALRDNGLVGR